MKQVYEQWVDAFQFDEELQELEQTFQEEHQVALKQQAVPPVRPERSNLLSEDDEAFLDELAVEISERMIQFVSEPEVLPHYLKLHALERDAHHMAIHIRKLLQENARKKREIQHLRRELDHYHQLIGPLYMKSPV